MNEQLPSTVTAKALFPKETEWGVTLGITSVPVPKFVTVPEQGLYGWKIDKHGIMAYGCSRLECEQNFVKAYKGETGIDLAQRPELTIH